MTWKVTPSLYNAWRFYAKPMFDRTPEDEAAARTEFIRVLRKEKGEVSDEMRRGTLFEEMIMQAVRGEPVMLPDELGKSGKPLFNPASSVVECATKIGQARQKGVFQEKDGRELPSGNYIYGVADCILLNDIDDFKYTDNYEMGKYQQSIQHLAYMYIWQLPLFNYVVGDGSPDPFYEPYTWRPIDSLATLESRIALMIWSINQDPEMRKIFAEFWSYKKENQ